MRIEVRYTMHMHRCGMRPIPVSIPVPDPAVVVDLASGAKIVWLIAVVCTSAVLVGGVPRVRGQGGPRRADSVHGRGHGRRGIADTSISVSVSISVPLLVPSVDVAVVGVGANDEVVVVVVAAVVVAVTAALIHMGREGRELGWKRHVSVWLLKNVTAAAAVVSQSKTGAKKGELSSSRYTCRAISCQVVDRF